MKKGTKAIKKQGIVIKSTGKWYIVKTQDDKTFRCRIAGKFRLEGKKLTNPVAVGDQVSFIIEDDEEQFGTITVIDNRTNYLVRQSPRKKLFLHLIAANIDQAVFITSLVQPKFKQGFVDRCLLMTEPFNIPSIIVFNKSDIYDTQDMAWFEYLKNMYQEMGYTVLLTSTVEHKGIDELTSLLIDKKSVFCGQSGVGKSSLLNTIQPGLSLETSEISDSSGKGQHTTTFAEMFAFNDSKGEIIDTPGIKTLSFNHLEIEDVAHNFRDFFVYSKQCKYSDCMHRNEPECAVKEALEKEELDANRYFSYLAILDEIEEQNYWQRQ